MLGRVARWAAAVLVLTAAGGYGYVNFSGHDTERWHVDPADAAPRGTPNEWLAAPEGATAAKPHMQTRVRPERPEELLARFDHIARSAPRTAVVAGSVDSGMVTYVQRTAVIGFPDYITVKAVSVGDGAGLIVWSRSRFGRDDFGVNRTRVETWLDKLEQA